MFNNSVKFCKFYAAWGRRCDVVFGCCTQLGARQVNVAEILQNPKATNQNITLALELIDDAVEELHKKRNNSLSQIMLATMHMLHMIKQFHTGELKDAEKSFEQANWNLLKYPQLRSLLYLTTANLLSSLYGRVTDWKQIEYYFQNAMKISNLSKIRFDYGRSLIKNCINGKCNKLELFFKALNIFEETCVLSNNVNHLYNFNYLKCLQKCIHYSKGFVLLQLKKLEKSLNQVDNRRLLASIRDVKNECKSKMENGEFNYEWPDEDQKENKFFDEIFCHKFAMGISCVDCDINHSHCLTNYIEKEEYEEAGALCKYVIKHSKDLNLKALGYQSLGKLHFEHPKSIIDHHFSIALLYNSIRIQPIGKTFAMMGLVLSLSFLDHMNAKFFFEHSLQNSINDDDLAESMMIYADYMQNIFGDIKESVEMSTNAANISSKVQPRQLTIPEKDVYPFDFYRLSQKEYNQLKKYNMWK